MAGASVYLRAYAFEITSRPLRKCGSTFIVKVTDVRVVRAGVSVILNGLLESKIHEFEPCLGRTWGE